MKNKFLNFDSIQGNYQNSGNPYKCIFDIEPPLRKCHKIFLKSVEIPVGFFSIRNDNSSTLSTFSFSVGVNVSSLTAYSFTY